MSWSTSTKSILKTPFVLFTIILMLKGYLTWAVTFGDPFPWKLILTELPYIWMLFTLVEFFASKRKVSLYILIDLLITAIYFAVIMYYKYYGVIVTYHALEQVNQVTAVRNSVFSLLDPYYLFIFTDIIIFFILALRNEKFKTWRLHTAKKGRSKGTFALFILSLVVCLFNILPNRASMSEITQAQEMGILSYETYTILAKENTDWIPSSNITQESINELKGVTLPSPSAYWQKAEGKNVIILQMESFQNFLIDLKIDGHEITPNMNKLAAGSLYFPNFYQQVGQGNTSDAEFVVNTSFYIPPNGAATQVYANKHLPSLPKLLKEFGYQTATFHTNDVEFWNRRELYAALGFDKYYAQEFFEDKDVIFFGSSDEVLYEKTADKLKEMDDQEKPFYAQVISMTAHHPYTIPEDKYQMTLPERYEDTFVGDYIRSQNYADYALGQFIEELKENGVWDNSLVITYGDHLGLPLYSLDNDDEELLQEIYGHEYSYADMMNIPLIISGNGITSSRVLEQIGGQVDVMPTIANLVGASLNQQIHFGQDLLNQSYNLLPERYYLPTGSFMSDSALFLPGNGYEDGTHYPFAGEGEDSISATEAEYERALKLLHLSDSYVSQLPDRVQE
ncbi:LTA synthase family protein [Paenibacillus crassostreae]|uniref:Sulfatase n=1 Tax=Paenibacillus crassostreae TaxID=1763538 RepID=A0A167B6Q7_9BACL|nr:LTA synthase family protein [Paenibacillus crassostreae]AOZ93125.1 sulfatase [Paenibacillus crassostreae]OAB71786.1 sulfatase [Paenibacillus crassostreae]